ncbi:hypothetical protein FRC04_008369 [Tulasnella sp. 424]|nr:hypothetical protein FRC04_008369 [Tulasnella sp. 424]KAG8976741.1 hypothetical protein FRC05_003091 [Tulasnella sp. 425]
MAHILALPQEIILEIAKALDIKEALALISTCKALHAITQARPFWLDQLRRLYELFHPLISRDFASLSIEDLRAMATRPYRFEQTVMQGKLRQVPPVRLKHNLDTEFLDAKIVPGGRWIVTANIDRGGPLVAFVRLWRLVPESSPQDALPCIASKQLHIGYCPLEMFVTAGEGSLDLLVLVNSLDTASLSRCYIHALKIDLAAEEPQFVILAEMKLEKYCSCIRLQGDSVVADLGVLHADESREFLLWDWKTGESRTLPSPGARGGTHLWDATGWKDTFHRLPTTIRNQTNGKNVLGRSFASCEIIPEIAFKSL